MAGIDFAQILSGIGYGSVERYLSFEFKMSKKERLTGEFEMNFKKSIFQWRSTLIKDFCLCKHEARSENG